MDQVKGDPLGSLPGCYPERNARARAKFDALERTFESQVPDVVRHAVGKRAQDPAAMARILDAFSEQCVQRVIAALDELLE
jgi:hypothetical protein